MLDTSIATTVVFAGFGLNFTGLVAGTNCRGCFVAEDWVGVFFVNSVWGLCILFKERMLSSMKRWGICKSFFGGGKLYFGVVVIENCAFTKIHQ